MRISGRLRDGSLIWSSERSGYSHIYRWKAGKWTQLTHGNWAVEKVLGVDEKARRVYFTGTAETPIEQQLYWVPLDRPAGPTRVTEGGWYNDAVMDKGATHALVKRSSTKPAVADLSCRCVRQAARLGAGECAECVAPLRAVPRQPCPADFRHDRRAGRHRSCTTGCSRRRGSRASATRSISTSMADRTDSR